MLVSQVADLARTLDATSFVARMPDPALIPREAIGALDHTGGFDTPERGVSIASFKLQPTHLDEPGEETSLDVTASPFEGAVAEATPPSGILRRDPELIFVAKSRRNPFEQMITVGRSQNNDIVLDDRSVSKVHAYFARTDFRWWIHDQPSTNGTFLDESPVPPTGLPLADGSKVSFGPRLAFAFYTARGLHHLFTGRR